MGAAKGNQNAKGHKGGGGRPSAYKEKATADMLAEIYFKTHSQEEIETDIRKGKFSIKQRHILNAMEGDQNAINVIFKKLFPDKIEMEEDITIIADV